MALAAAGLSPRHALDQPAVDSPPDAARENSPSRRDDLGRGAAAEDHLWLALRSAEQRGGEFWETLIFVAFWLSGLFAVGLCFF